jgi:hypothetical protein
VAARDRDSLGRPRNSRPRDRLGQPLARDADGRMPADPPALPPLQALARAQELIDADEAFAAHEVLEATWKSVDGEERELWRGLAQLAVGITHRDRGNSKGASALLRRGAANISRFADQPPYDVAVAALIEWAESESTNLSGGSPPRLRGQAADERDSAARTRRSR